MAAASASTALPPGDTPAPTSSAPRQAASGPAPVRGAPPPALPRPRGELALPRPPRRPTPPRRLSTSPLPAQARRLSTSSPHSAFVPPPAHGAQHHHHDAHGPAPSPFVFGLVDENRPPPTLGSRKRKRKRGAAPDLFNAMHRPLPGPEGLNTPYRLAAGASRATVTPSTRRILRPSKTSANVAAAALQDRRGCARPSMPARQLQLPRRLA
ncbi:lysine-rich arabinogalactan protein 19-like [Panicum virgatum]|uniref:Uncharacterized protein n=1 Tax=Panicum virgatum TaxID=38727 RepID=A0A8T0MGZ3_PANVG|nr:lysine-rich arabinogalactan protein 19-like [Panicum virgatum]KAG2536631.1 hypothetical protein PVAP13_9NG208846 [Panicum virgatum]